MDYFYRVEIPAPPIMFGIGPYFGFDVEQRCIDGDITLSNLEELVKLANNLTKAHSSWGRNPKPSLKRDFPFAVYGDIPTEEYVCGFSNVDELKEWFDGFLADLSKLGYKMVKYEVESLVCGYSQQQFFACQDDIISREILELPKK